MQFTFKLDNPLVGFAAKTVGKGATSAPVAVQGFTTSEDGPSFFDLLENMSGLVLGQLQTGQRPSESTIDRMLVACHRDGTVNVWINEPELLSSARIRESVEAGQPITTDMIIDVAELVPKGVVFPDDVGFIAVLSAGWRKGMVWDLSPARPGAAVEPRNVPEILAGVYTYLMFQKRFSLEEDEWKTLLDQGWFPFAGLPESIVKNMVVYLRGGLPIDDLLPEIIAHVKKSLPQLRSFFEKNVKFTRHRKLVLEALELFEKGYHGGATHILFMRAEGILRDHFALSNGGAPSPKKHGDLIASTQNVAMPHAFSLLMPERFRAYLNEIVFGFEDFVDPANVKRLTRHSLGHGVAPEDAFDEKSSVLGILIVQQMAYLLSKK